MRHSKALEGEDGSKFTGEQTKGSSQKDGETKRGDRVNESILGPLKDRSVLVLPCFTMFYQSIFPSHCRMKPGTSLWVVIPSPKMLSEPIKAGFHHDETIKTIKTIKTISQSRRKHGRSTYLDVRLTHIGPELPQF